MLRDIGMLLRSRIASHLGHGSDVSLIDTTPMLKTSLCHSQVCGKCGECEKWGRRGEMCERVWEGVSKVYTCGAMVATIVQQPTTLSTLVSPGSVECGTLLPCARQDHIYCRILAQAAVDAAFAGVADSDCTAD